MKLEFNSIVNKHQNVPALVLGHGISLNRMLPHLQEYKDRGFIIFDCNEFFAYHKVIPDYYVLANTVNTMFNLKDKINSYVNLGLTILYADVVDLTHRDWIKKYIKTNYISYDQRHFNSQRCGFGGYGGGKSDMGKSCCDHIIQGRLTIQEELAKYTGLQKLYSGGDTCVLHMLSFAIIMGCNPIYTIGFDLNYREGYADHPYGDVPPEKVDILDDSMGRLMNDISIIYKHSLKVNRKIINLNYNSIFYVFPIQKELP